MSFYFIRSATLRKTVRNIDNWGGKLLSENTQFPRVFISWRSDRRILFGQYWDGRGGIVT